MFILLVNPTKKTFRIVHVNDSHKRQNNEVRIGDIHTEVAANRIAREMQCKPS